MRSAISRVHSCSAQNRSEGAGLQVPTLVKVVVPNTENPQTYVGECSGTTRTKMNLVMPEVPLSPEVLLPCGSSHRCVCFQNGSRGVRAIAPRLQPPTDRPCPWLQCSDLDKCAHSRPESDTIRAGSPPSLFLTPRSLQGFTCLLLWTQTCCPPPTPQNPIFILFPC